MATREAPPEKDDKTREEPGEIEVLQDLLELERTLSTRLMRLVINERTTIHRLHGLLSEQKATTKEAAGDREICPDCKTQIKLERARLT